MLRLLAIPGFGFWGHFTSDNERLLSRLTTDSSWPVAAPYLNQTSKSDRIRLPRCQSSQQRQSSQRPAGSTSEAPPPKGAGMPRPSTLGEVTGNALFDGVVGATAGAVAVFGTEEAGAALPSPS